MSKATPDPGSAEAQRAHAHDLLDTYLDKLLKRKGAALTNDSPEEAGELFVNGLEFVCEVMGSDLQESALPKLLSNSPFELRQALIATIALLSPAWPYASRIPERRFSNGIWAGDVITALKMLDLGETMPIFEAANGFGNHRWTERRFQLVAALWAIHLRYGKKLKANDANNRVAQAFNNAADFGGEKRLPEGQVENWLRRIKKVAAGKIREEGLSSIHAALFITEAKRSVPCANWSEERRLQIFYTFAFGDPDNAPKSLDEAGKWYQEFKALKKSDPDATLKRKQRANKLEKDGNT